MTDSSTRSGRQLICSFCARVVATPTEALIGHGAVICATCLELNRKAAFWGVGEQTDTPRDGLSDKEMLTRLGDIIAIRAQAEQMMHDQVRLLRQRDVSWARIGEVLSVSRQAAWHRFTCPPGAVTPRTETVRD